MGNDTMDLAADAAVEATLRDELVRESRALSAVVPVLRHLLRSDAQTLVSEAAVAHVRGMILDCAAQIIAASEGHDPATRAAGLTDRAAVERFAEAMFDDAALVSFCHALATEGLVAALLQQRGGIDPVLSPLLQELIASENPAIASLAMSTLAAQSRFIQSQRRMTLPLGELPAEQFHALIARAAPDARDPGALERLQAQYDEAASRLALLARLVNAMGRGAIAALELDHAGLALFVEALAAATRAPRAATVTACHEGQGTRLALMLCAAGLSPDAVERQVELVEPARRMPLALARLSPTRAASVLADGAAV